MAAPARGQFIMRQVNLAYLAQRADIIVQGRVLDVRYEGHPEYQHVLTVRVTMEVQRMLRGPEGRRFSFREWVPSPRTVAGKRGYLVGQHLVLFMLSPSRYGLSGPIGREQGLFHVLRDAQGRELVANEFGNAGLFKNVPEAAEQAGVSLSDKQLSLTSTPGGPVKLEDFVSLVEHLKSLPRVR